MMIRTPSLAFRLSAALVPIYLVASSPFLRAQSNQAPSKPKAAAQQTALAEEEEGKRIIRVYLIEDLVFTPPDYPYEGNLPTKGPFDRGGARSGQLGGGAMRGGMGGGAGGMGGGMGGGGMGGGTFSVPEKSAPPQILRQLGGGPPAGGAGAGVGGMGGVVGQAAAPRSRAAQLVNLIEAVVKGEWNSDDADKSDKCIIFGNNLVVRATSQSHEQISELLKSLKANNANRSVTVEATWVVLDAQKVEALQTPDTAPADSRHTLALDRGRLNRITNEAAAFRGRITCLNGQTVHLATGQRRVIPSGATPTVGVGAVGYAPTTEVLNIGAVLQVTPMVSTTSERRTATVDIHSVVTQWGKQGEPLHVSSQSATGSSEKALGGPLVTYMSTIDRANVGTQEWSTTVEVPVGEPILVGASTLTDSAEYGSTAEAAKRPQLALIIEVKPNF